MTAEDELKIKEIEANLAKNIDAAKAEDEIQTNMKKETEKNKSASKLNRAIKGTIAKSVAAAMKKTDDVNKNKDDDNGKKKPRKSRYQEERENYYGRGSSYDKESSISPHLLLFFGAIAIHLADIFFFKLPFVRDGNSIPVLLGAYIIFTVIAVLVVYKSGLSSETWTVAGISLAAFILPFITNFFSLDWFILILMFAPVWGVYLLLNPGDSKFLAWAGKWYVFIMLTLGIWTLLTSSIVSSQIGGITSSSGADVSSALDVGKHFFIDNTKDIWTAIWNIPGRINRRINQTFSTSYFTGQVEQNEQEPLGVYLEDLKAMEPFFYENNPVIIWATLRGKSFEGKINVKNYCYINLGDGKRVNGVVSPFDPELFYDESRPLECIFEDGLKKGYYTVTFISTFEFPTWGYVEYTFVDRATRIAYYSQGEDINRDLSIPKKSIMIYTNGPVSIGSNARDMPIVIYPDDDASLQRFGITVANIWPQGKVLTLTNLEIQAPEGIILDDCIPKSGKSKTETDGRIIYTFKLDSPKEFFTTETCQMKLSNKDNFLEDNLKVTKTFAIKAEYIYSLEKTISIRVVDI